MKGAFLIAIATVAALSLRAADFDVSSFGAKPDGTKCTAAFAAAMTAANASSCRPPLVRFSRCSGLCIGSVALHNAPGKVVEIADCENAVFSSVEFIANVQADDFISVPAGSRPVVRSCSFRIGDGTWDVLDPRHRSVDPY